MPAVVIAPHPLDLEPGGGVERDRARVVDPDLERDLVRAARAGVLLDGGQQCPPATAPAGIGEDRHADREDPGRDLLHRGMPDLEAIVVFENPERGRLAAFDDLPEARRALLDVDRRLGAQESLGGDDRHRTGRVGQVSDMCPADDHAE